MGEKKEPKFKIGQKVYVRQYDDKPTIIGVLDLSSGLSTVLFKSYMVNDDFKGESYGYVVYSPMYEDWPVLVKESQIETNPPDSPKR